MRTRIAAILLGLVLVATACGGKDRQLLLEETSTSAGATTPATDPTASAPGPTAASPTTVTPETTIPGTISQETLQALTVTTVEANKCLELVGSGDGYVGWDIGALKRTVPDGPRLWNDSISIPLGEAGAEPSTMFREFQTNVCEDPILGSTWAYMFAHMEIGGVRVIDLNPWLEPFAVEPEEINDVARSFVPLVDVANPSTEQQTAAAEANRSWQAYALRIVTLFERFTVGDVQSWTSVWNMHLTGGGVIVGNFPEVGVNPNQEALPALILSVTERISARRSCCLASMWVTNGQRSSLLRLAELRRSKQFPREPIRRTAAPRRAPTRRRQCRRARLCRRRPCRLARRASARRRRRCRRLPRRRPRRPPQPRWPDRRQRCRLATGQPIRRFRRQRLLLRRRRQPRRHRLFRQRRRLKAELLQRSVRASL
jgi:hypothetical protein